jgi:hypothetical protein
MISARTKAVLAAAKRRGVKLGRDPWGSIDGQGTSNWVGNGCPAGNGRRSVPARALCRHGIQGPIIDRHISPLSAGAIASTVR